MFKTGLGRCLAWRGTAEATNTSGERCSPAASRLAIGTTAIALIHGATRRKVTSAASGFEFFRRLTARLDAEVCFRLDEQVLEPVPTAADEKSATVSIAWNQE
jgi:hypothetical protein